VILACTDIEIFTYWQAKSVTSQLQGTEIALPRQANLLCMNIEHHLSTHSKNLRVHSDRDSVYDYGLKHRDTAGREDAESAARGVARGEVQSLPKSGQ
jgi:hypothetical protein